MASVLVSAAHVLVSEDSILSTGSREPASVSRPASRPNLDGLGLGHTRLGLVLGGPSLDYNPGLYNIKLINKVFEQKTLDAYKLRFLEKLSKFSSRSPSLLFAANRPDVVNILIRSACVFRALFSMVV